MTKGLGETVFALHPPLILIFPEFSHAFFSGSARIFFISGRTGRFGALSGESAGQILRPLLTWASDAL